MRHAWWIFLALAAACHRQAPAAADDEDEHEHEAPPVPVRCEAPTEARVTDAIVVRGVVAAPPDRQLTLAPAVPGRLANVAHDGQRVAKGDVLAVVEDPQLAAALGDADAQVATAQAADGAARAAAARAHRLVDEGVAARKEAEEADARAAAAAAELKAARGKRVLADAQRERARLKAPFAGAVVRVLRRSGELVDGTPGTPVLELADATTLELRGDAAAADLVRLADGQTAEVRLDALPAAPLAGRVLAVAQGVDPASSSGWVRVALASEPDAGVHPRLGLAGSARVELGARVVATVPEAAVVRGAGGAPQVVVCDGEKARVAAVTLGARAGDRVEIAEGLKAGERIVVDHALGLEDGAAIAERKR